MTPTLFFTLAAVCAGPKPVAAYPRAPDFGVRAGMQAEAPADTLAARLFDEGLTFPTFLAATEQRRDTWHANYERARVFDDLVERARAVPGVWRLLVVAIDSCGDSANTIPYLARFVEAVDGVELRVVEPDVGQPVMDAHPTPDGRGATPTVVVLDEAGNDVGCWAERPSGLQSWWLANPDGLSTRDKLARKYAWYDEDAGYHTILEVVESIEAAARGENLCSRPAEPVTGLPTARAGGGAQRR